MEDQTYTLNWMIRKITKLLEQSEARLLAEQEKMFKKYLGEKREKPVQK